MQNGICDYPALIHEIFTILMDFLPLIIGIHREGKVRRKLLILCYKKIWDEEYKSGMGKDKICNIK